MVKARQLQHIVRSIHLRPSLRILEMQRSAAIGNAMAEPLSIVMAHLRQGTSFSSAVNAARKRHPDLDRYFEISVKRNQESFHLRSNYLFPKYRKPELALLTSGEKYIESSLSRDFRLAVTEKPPGAVEFTAALMSGLYSRPTLTRQFPAMTANSRWAKILPLLTSATCSPHYDFSLPGIHRLQHACLLFKSKSAGVLIDPRMRTQYEPANLVNPIFPNEIIPHVNAILISHSHPDHYSPLTLAMFPKDIPIYVPAVKKASLVSDKIADELSDLGFSNVRPISWGEDFKVKDIDISALPFYGEQPTRSERPSSPHLWNHGNTYLVRSPEFSAWCLVDSGSDARGSVTELAEEVQKRFGSVDAILSNVRSFRVRTVGVGNNWFGLNDSQLRQFKVYGNEIVTAGPKGLAEACKLTQARYFLPYAHWWHSPRRTIAEDSRLSQNLAEAFKKVGNNTKILSWNVSDRFIPGRKPVRPGRH